MKYYTSAEARKALGNIHPSKLKQYVDSGILKRYVPPGQKQGKYSVEEVEALARELRNFYGDENDERKPGDGRTVLGARSSLTTAC